MTLDSRRSQHTPLYPPKEWIRIAHLVRPQGRRGELLADLLTDFPERFAQHPSVFLVAGKQAAPQPTTPKAGTIKSAAPKAAAPKFTPLSSPPKAATIIRHWLHKGRVVLKFQGIDSINDAETLRGWDVVIPREARVPLTDGAVYLDDLIGCVLADTSQPGAPVVGIIRDILPQGEMPDLLVVRSVVVSGNVVAPTESETKPAEQNKNTEYLVPFAKAYRVRVDVVARRVEMEIPAGLLAVNAPLSAEEEAKEQQ